MLNKKFVSSIILAIFLIIIPVNKSLAQEKNNEASSSTETTQQSIKDIQKIIQNKLKSGEVAGAIDNLLNRKIGMIGKVSRITDETITIKNSSGTKILALDDNPQIIKNKKPIEVGKIEVGNWVTVLGRLKDDNFSPNFIFVSNKSLRPRQQTVLVGTIIEISKTKVIVLSRSDKKEITFKLTKETKFLDSNSNDASIKNFSKDINILITGLKDKDDITASTLKSLVPLSNE